MIVTLPEWLPIMENAVYLYELLDPRTNEVRYIGQTNNLKNRYTQHISPSKLKTNTHKNNWIKDLLSVNLKPIMRVVNISNRQNITKEEIKQIREKKNLTNSIIEKNGNFSPSQEMRDNLSRQFKGKPRIGHTITKDQQIKLAEARKNSPKHQAHVKKLIELGNKRKCKKILITKDEISICFFSIKDAQKYVKICALTFRRYIKSGKLINGFKLEYLNEKYI